MAERMTYDQYQLRSSVTMATFDRLPARLRAMINDSPYAPSDKNILELATIVREQGPQAAINSFPAWIDAVRRQEEAKAQSLADPLAQELARLQKGEATLEELRKGAVRVRPGRTRR